LKGSPATGSLVDLLQAVVALASEAGVEILRLYDGELAVQTKADDSPLTAADLAAHRWIMAGLGRLTPHIPRLSEEGGTIPFAERRSWTRLWLTDPLDGTREFVKRNGEFTVNIALIDDGRPVLGVVHAPALATTYYAADGAGAWKQVGNGAATRLHAVATRQPPLLLASRSHATPELEALLTRLPPHETLRVGSSLKFCWVAEGRADLYLRLGSTSEWDTAAGQCIVEAAGGIVTDTAGSPLRYNTRASMLNPHFMVAGERTYPWRQYLSG
jgi:3'(2'), 5'-bisphosphate nucleotidase